MARSARITLENTVCGGSFLPRASLNSRVLVKARPIASHPQMSSLRTDLPQVHPQFFLLTLSICWACLEPYRENMFWKFKSPPCNLLAP